MPSQPPPILPATPYLFQRLERVQERLATDHLPPLLDTACKTWYVHRIATALVLQRGFEMWCNAAHHPCVEGGQHDRPDRDDPTNGFGDPRY